MPQDAPRDQNFVPAAIFQVDGAARGVLMPGQIDDTTGRILVDGGGGSISPKSPTAGSVNGVNATFTWAVAPQIIVVDQGRTMQKISSDGTVNWTGTTSTTLAIAPTFDIFAL